VEGLAEVLATVTARRFVLISTIDVYTEPGDSTAQDEASLATAPEPSHPYGRHRRWFERRMQQQFGTGLHPTALQRTVNPNPNPQVQAAP